MLAKAIKLSSVNGLRLKSCVIVNNEEGGERKQWNEIFLLQVYFTQGKSKIQNQILKINASQQCAYSCAHYLSVQNMAQC